MFSESGSKSSLGHTFETPSSVPAITVSDLWSPPSPTKTSPYEEDLTLAYKSLLSSSFRERTFRRLFESRASLSPNHPTTISHSHPPPFINPPISHPKIAL